MILYCAVVIGYLPFLASQINWKDSGELATGGFLLSPVHFPGYPLYLQAQKLVSFLPLGAISSRMAFLNLILGSMSLLLLLRFYNSLSATFPASGSPAGKFAALLLTLTATTGTIFLEESIWIENTMPFVFLLCLALIFIQQSSHAVGAIRKGAVILLLFSYHPQIWLIGSTVLLGMALLRRSIPILRVTIGIGLLAILFSSTYLFLPFRTGRPLRLSETGALTLEELIQAAKERTRKPTLQRRDSEAGSKPDIVRRIENTLSFLKRSPDHPGSNERQTERDHKKLLEAGRPQLVDPFRVRFFARESAYLLVPLAILGALILIRTYKTGAALQITLFLAFGAVTLSQSGQELRGQSIPLMVLVIALAMWFCAGMSQSTTLRRRTAWILVVSASALAIVRNVRTGIPMIRAGSQATSHAVPIGESFLTHAAPNSLLFISNPRLATVLYYLEYIENRRPDITLVVEPLLSSPYYWEETRLRLGILRINPEATAEPFVERYGDRHYARIAGIRDQVAAIRPIYRDESFARIRLDIPATPEIDSSIRSRIDWDSFSVDPWQRLKFLVNVLTPEAASSSVEVFPPPIPGPIWDCGMLYTLTPPPESCAGMRWVHERSDLDIPTKEILALYHGKRAEYHFEAHQMPEGMDELRRMIGLDPKSLL